MKLFGIAGSIVARSTFAGAALAGSLVIAVVPTECAAAPEPAAPALSSLDGFWFLSSNKAFVLLVEQGVVKVISVPKEIQAQAQFRRLPEIGPATVIAKFSGESKFSGQWSDQGKSLSAWDFDATTLESTEGVVIDHLRHFGAVKNCLAEHHNDKSGDFDCKKTPEGIGRKGETQFFDHFVLVYLVDGKPFGLEFPEVTVGTKGLFVRGSP